MKASRAHYFFAQEWPAKIWLAAFALLSAVITASQCWGILGVSWASSLIFVGLVLLGALLGYFVGFLVGWPILGPIYYGRGLMNGEPFHPGEMVQILVGPHRDRIVQVMETYDHGYAGGHLVRVDLGTDEDNFFRSIQILRMEPHQSQGPATADSGQSQSPPSSAGEA